ncbi:MAG TPA: hypothetical protein VMD53_15505 [Rhizomicrobium sp.]|nr:hypothetical protein [Rhizomicrobium sp.]
MIRLFAPLVALSLFFAGVAHAAQPGSPPDLNMVRTVLAGTWQSTDDTKFTRELDADGKAVDRYEGDASATTPGRWMLFLGSKPPVGTAGRAFQPDVVYLRLEQNGDVLLFALAGLSRSDMKMVYLERGNLMSFVRLK